MNIYEYMRKRFTHCEVCGSGEFLEVHHVLFHRMKGHPELNCVENLAVVCHKCHSNGDALSKKFQKLHYAHRLAEGYNMKEWNDNLPLKAKERFG